MYASYYNSQEKTSNEISIEPKSSTNQIQQTITKPSKQLPEKAVCLMNAWYIAHEDNPYPNRNDLDYLATNGGIKESQVKAWFSNKRNRTQNTHPKRAKRYLLKNQTQQNSNLWNEPQKIHLADEFEQRVLTVQQQQQQTYSHNQLPTISPTNWPWLPSNSYDYYQHY